MLKKEALALHQRLRGKIEIVPKLKKVSKRDVRLLYTPGVAEVSREIARRKMPATYAYTIKGNSVAVVSDGSSVLGLGNVGPYAALPVMEGKCLLFKKLAGIDAFPLCLDVKRPEEIVQAVKAIAPVFGGINLEDIAAPKCFGVEEALQDLGIPVLHDDQHCTAIVVLAALMNAARVVGKNLEELRVVVCGAGAAGQAIARLLVCADYEKSLCDGVRDVIVCDHQGIMYRGRDHLDEYKTRLARITNRGNRKGMLADALDGADAVIGVSRGNVITEQMVKRMNIAPIVFALANPTPEIMPERAKRAGAAVIATGRSDYPNQVNNVLAFPGVFRGALDARVPRVTNGMKLAAAHALARLVKQPSKNAILPSLLDKRVVKSVAQAVARER